MKKQTADILKKCGVPPHLIGYEYLGEAVEMVIEDHKHLHAIVNLYQTIAKKNNSTYGSVERAIRKAISVAFDSNLDPDTLYSIFGNTLSLDKAQPTNAHFIAAVAELIKYEQ